jgi:hypothetical protein
VDPLLVDPLLVEELVDPPQVLGLGGSWQWLVCVLHHQPP